MYLTASNDAYAIDAATGKQLWHYARPVTQGLIDDASGHISRGAALRGQRLYMETDNAHLLCLDARTGDLLWDVAYAEGNRNYGATSAPLIVKDKVLVGTSGGDDGVRGFLAAFNADTGKEAWRFWTVPAPGQPGSETWPAGDIYLHGGGTAWMPGTYDPDLNLIYWGTGNPSPDFDGDAREGDNLYTASVLAINPDTGSLKWHFQFTPHDVNDYDAEETPVLVDTTFQGHRRRLLVQANRNGFIYVLDRATGQILAGDAIRPAVELGVRHRRSRPAHPHRSHADGRGHAHVSQLRGRHQLVLAHMERAHAHVPVFIVGRLQRLQAKAAGVSGRQGVLLHRRAAPAHRHTSQIPERLRPCQWKVPLEAAA